MNERSFIVPFPIMPHKRTETADDRRRQILDAAIVCFARTGFHQTSMHDISAEAGISVGLIYRYFKNKDEVISAIADGTQKRDRAVAGARPARRRPCLNRSRFCSPPTAARIRRRSSRLSWWISSPKPDAIRVWLSWCAMSCGPRRKGVTDLIARSPDSKHVAHGLEAREIAEMIFAMNDGTMMRSVLQPSGMSPAKQRAHQLDVARTLWRLLFAGNSRAAHA